VSLPTHNDGIGFCERTAPRARSRLTEQTPLASNRPGFRSRIQIYQALGILARYGPARCGGSSWCH